MARNPDSDTELSDDRTQEADAAERPPKGSRKPRSASRSIGDVKRAQAGERGKSTKIATIVIIAIVTGATALAVAGAAFSGSSLFTIEQLSVSGVEHLTDTEVVQLADIPEGCTLLRVDTDAVRERFLMDAWIEDVSVWRLFPNTLAIQVTERQVKAIAEVPSADASTTRMWAISDDGMWLMPVPEKDSEAGKLVNQKIYEDVENVLHITDVPYGTQPEIGTYCSDENVNTALNIVAGMTTDLVDQVVTVKATDSASATLILDSGVEVVFGSSDDIRDKERVCLELLEKYGDSVTYINVSVVDSPTCRHI